MPTTWKEDKINYKYTELPEEPGYRKKAPKRKVKKSNHKHIYADCAIKFLGENADSFFGGYIPGTYCTICGKVHNIKFIFDDRPTDNVPHFIVEGKILDYKKVKLNV